MTRLQQQPEHLFEVVNDSVMTRTMEGRINTWNHSAAELYGWRKEEAIGRISHDLLQTRFPKPLEEIESELVRKGRWEGKLVHTTRDGSRVVVASRWALDTEGHPGVVVEINARSNNRDSDVKPSIKTEDILAKIANIVLGGGALLATLVSFYFLYHYEWTAQRQFTDSISKMISYFVPIGLGVFLLASLGFKPSYKINLALICAAVVVSVFGMELFLELSDSKLSSPRKPAMLNLMEYSTDKKKDAAELTKKFGVEIDTRTAGEVIASLQKTGVDAVPIVVPGQVFIDGPNNSIKSVLKIHGEEVMPLGGIADRFTVLCNENGQWITYKSDKHGFNNPSEAWQSGAVDVAILGDSYAQGFCVSPDRNLGALIRQRYAATLNLAMAGSGPMLELATLKEFLQHLKPKVVLWFYYEGNDLIDLQKERRNELLMRYLKDDFRQNLVARQSEIDQVVIDDIPRQSSVEATRRSRRKPYRAGVIDKFLEFARLGELRKKLSMINATTPQELANTADLEGPNIDLFRDILAQVKSRVVAWEGKVYFVYLPDWSRYSGGKLDLVVQQRAAVLALVKNLGIPIIDIHAVFQAQSDPLSLFPFREPGHYTEKANQLVAEEVLRAISSNSSQSASNS